jgi:hypothetical protein
MLGFFCHFQPSFDLANMLNDGSVIPLVKSTIRAFHASG